MGSSSIALYVDQLRLCAGGSSEAGWCSDGNNGEPRRPGTILTVGGVLRGGESDATTTEVDDERTVAGLVSGSDEVE